MQIVEKDFTLEPTDSSSFNLTFNRKVKKRDTGKFEIEPGPTQYGLSLSTALMRIARHRTAKKYEEQNITLFEYLKDFQKSYKEIIKLCKDTLPEKVNYGD